MLWRSRRSGSIRLSASRSTAPSAPSTSSSSRRFPGCTGSTRTACTPRSGISPRSRWRRSTTVRSTPDSNRCRENSPSTKPGAIHSRAQQQAPQKPRLEDASRGVRGADTLTSTTWCCNDRLNLVNTPRPSSRTGASRTASPSRWAPLACAGTTPWPSRSSPT